MKLATMLHRIAVSVIAALVAGCHPIEPPSSNQNVPSENSNEVSADSPSRLDTQCPVHLEQWYQNEIDHYMYPVSRLRYMISKEGARLQVMLKSDLYRLDGAFFDMYPLREDAGDIGYAIVVSGVSEQRLMDVGVESRPGDSKREFVLADLSKYRVGSKGEWVEVLSGAPVEFTDTTVSVSMEHIDESWMNLLLFSRGKDRFRVADDGLRLIGFDDPENWTFTLE